MTIQKRQDLQTYDDNQMNKQVVFTEPKSKAIAFNFLPGQIMPTHGHPQKNAYMSVMEGTGVCYLDDTPSPIQQGDMIHCDPHQTISVKNTGTDAMTVYVVLAEK